MVSTKLLTLLTASCFTFRMCVFLFISEDFTNVARPFHTVPIYHYLSKVFFGNLNFTLQYPLTLQTQSMQKFDIELKYKGIF